MKLFLVQHGEAKPQSEDPARSLSEKGRKEVEKVAGAADKLGMKPDSIFHSGKLRAGETAGIIARVLESAKPEAVSGLSPNDDVETWAKKISLLDEDMALVGHLPFMDRLASLLLCGNERSSVVRFRYGAIVCIERDPEGGWHLEWIIAPDMV